MSSQCCHFKFVIHTASLSCLKISYSETTSIDPKTSLNSENQSLIDTKLSPTPNVLFSQSSTFQRFPPCQLSLCGYIFVNSQEKNRENQKAIMAPGIRGAVSVWQLGDLVLLSPALAAGSPGGGPWVGGGPGYCKCSLIKSAGQVSCPMQALALSMLSIPYGLVFHLPPRQLLSTRPIASAPRGDARALRSRLGGTI